MKRVERECIEPWNLEISNIANDKKGDGVGCFIE